MSNKIKIIAFYLPQFHPIPENDKWWMKGFTEWTNVGKAKRLFPGHNQPRIPADLGYYDLRVPETRKAQAELAQQYGIEGFCYWHYWFGNGKRLLDRPFNEVLKSKEPNFPFCLAWANESWRGFYHGIKTKETLIEQLYPGEKDDINHFYAVLPAFKDDRYMKIEQKPIFLIYHPFEHPQMSNFISLWQKLAVENGLKGIYFIAQTYYIEKDKKKLFLMGFDSLNPVRLFDFESKAKCNYLFSKLVHKIFRVPKILNYKIVSRFFVGDEEYAKNIFPTIIPNWDHSPRSQNKALVLRNSTPELFDKHVNDVFKRIENKPSEYKIAFVKSWNEWAEGNYLEPDIKYGLRFLEVIKKYVIR